MKNLPQVRRSSVGDSSKVLRNFLLSNFKENVPEFEQRVTAIYVLYQNYVKMVKGRP